MNLLLELNELLSEGAITLTRNGDKDYTLRYIWGKLNMNKYIVEGESLEDIIMEAYKEYVKRLGFNPIKKRLKDIRENKDNIKRINDNTFIRPKRTTPLKVHNFKDKNIK